MWKAILLAFMMAEPTLVPGTSMTYTDGTRTWAGNPGCAEAGFLLQADSPAIDQGELIEGVHCPVAGPSPDGNCQEWYGKAPDIGACEYVGVIIVPPKPYQPTDDFARANGPLGPNWLSGYSGNNPFTIVNQQIQGTVVTDSNLQTWSKPATSDHAGTIRLTTYNDGGDFAVVLRASAPPTQTYYYIAASFDSPSSTYIYRCVSGSCTAVEDNSVIWRQGDTIRASAVGAVISVYRNGSSTPLFTWTDPSPLTGMYVGIGSYARSDLAGMAADDFLIESLGGQVVPTVPQPPSNFTVTVGQ